MLIWDLEVSTSGCLCLQLQATNEEGNSKWSDVVSFRTLPDRPQYPCKLQVKGRVTSNSFRCTWGACLAGFSSLSIASSRHTCPTSDSALADRCVHLWIIFTYLLFATSVPSVLWHCWLGGRKGIRPVKTEWWGAGVVICLERGADLHTAQLTPLPLTVSCFSKIQIDFTFLVLAHLGSPGQRAVKRVCVCVCY